MVKILKRLLPQPVKNIKHYIVSNFYHFTFGRPSKKLKVIGVTGTDGKTTTANMIYEILRTSGKKVGLVSTINAKIGDKELSTGYHVTTPSPKLMQQLLKQMVDEGLEYAIIETTSHALDQFRVGGIKYAAAVYTNVTHEHLDYHHTYEAYLRTKAKLMKLLTPEGIIILNKDDASFEKLLALAENTKNKILTYGFRKDADIRATDTNGNRKINHFLVEKGNKVRFDVRLKLLGGYNVYNALAAISISLEMGVPPKDIVKALEGMQMLEGRWEVIQEKPFKVVVDFAHTPNALEQVLTFAQNQKDQYHNLILVFGCAGERDVKKRPQMGDVAGRLADKIILTAEDPRGESVDQINKQIAEGLRRQNRRPNKDYLSIPDRRSAIRKSIEIAKPGDLVLITGKGHEKSMNLDGKTEVPWSDQEVVSQIIQS